MSIEPFELDDPIVVTKNGVNLSLNTQPCFLLDAWIPPMWVFKYRVFIHQTKKTIEARSNNGRDTVGAIGCDVDF